MRPTIHVIGASIPGVLVSALLARRLAASHDLRLYAGPPPDARRLVNGCTLRVGALALMADALGCTEQTLWARFHGARSGFSGIEIARYETRGDGFLGQGRPITADFASPIALSTRHGEILTALREQLPKNVTVSDTSVELSATAEGLAPKLTLGADDLVINASPRALKPPPAPRRYVCAVQVPLRSKRARPARGYTPALRSTYGDELLFITPFWDSAHADADWYGINTMLVSAQTRERVGPEALLAHLQKQLLSFCASQAFDVIDAEGALGGACVPVVENFVALAASAGRITDLAVALSSGAPAINTDGMLAQTAGAWHFANALAADPTANGAVRAMAQAQRGLGQVRFWNRFVRYSFFDAPLWLRAVLLLQTRLSMASSVKLWANLGLAGVLPTKRFERTRLLA